jgi:hypothetical protein
VEIATIDSRDFTKTGGRGKAEAGSITLHTLGVKKLKAKAFSLPEKE